MDLSKLTVEDLRDMATNRGLEHSGLRKAELIALLQADPEPGEEPSLKPLARSDGRRWWCPRCDHSHALDLSQCVRCGWELS